MIYEIVTADIPFVSLVGKGANGKDFIIVKTADGKPTRTWESPIIKVDDEQHLVTGIVYEPDTIDSQGEFMSAPAIEKAAHKFLADYRNVDLSHTFKKQEDAVIVESYVAKSDHEIEGTPIKTGTWVLTTYIGSDEVWEQVKKGELNAYSMGGSGERVERPDLDPDVKKADSHGPIHALVDVIHKVLAKFDAVPVQAEAVPAQAAPVDFAALVNASLAEENLSEARWVLSDVIRNILSDPTIVDKNAAIGTQIDAFKGYVLQQIQAAGVEKALAELSAPVAKSGRKLSAKTLADLKAAAETIQSIISGAESSEEGEDDVKKEDIEAIVKEQLAPVNERLTKLEKSRSAPKSDDPDGNPVAKQDEDHYLHGVL